MKFNNELHRWLYLAFIMKVEPHNGFIALYKLKKEMELR